MRQPDTRQRLILVTELDDGSYEIMSGDFDGVVVVETDSIEVTFGGSFATEPDIHRRYIAGPQTTRIEGEVMPPDRDKCEARNLHVALRSLGLRIEAEDG